MKVRINEYLSEIGMSKTELASRMGISLKSLSKRLTGYSRCDIEFVQSVADALGISALSLLEDDKSVVVSTFKSDNKRFEIREIKD